MTCNKFICCNLDPFSLSVEKNRCTDWINWINSRNIVWMFFDKAYPRFQLTSQFVDFLNKNPDPFIKEHLMPPPFFTQRN